MDYIIIISIIWLNKVYKMSTLSDDIAWIQCVSRNDIWLMGLNAMETFSRYWDIPVGAKWSEILHFTYKQYRGHKLNAI